MTTAPLLLLTLAIGPAQAGGASPPPIVPPATAPTTMPGGGEPTVATPGTGAAPPPGAVGGTIGGPATIAKGAHGIVVRLDAGAQKVETPVVVHLKPVDGPLTDVQLKDDGAPPDVSGGDGTWSGTAWNEHDEFEVSINLGANRVEGGRISWLKEDLQRDLSLTWFNGQLKAEASVANDVPGGAGAGSGSGTVTGAPPGGDGAPPTGASGTAPSGPPKGGFQLDAKAKGSGPSASASTSSDATLYVGIGGCGFALAFIVHLYRRGRSRTTGLPDGLTLVPEAGFLGAGTPAVSEGLTQWVVAPGDAHDLLRPLVATLARHHRVVICAPSRSAVPSVPGGPVYRIEPGKPRDLLAAVETVMDMGAGGVAVLLLGDGLDGAALKTLGDALPDGVGGAVVVMQVLMTTLPVAHAERRGDTWRLRFAKIEVDVVEREDGFVRV